MNFGVKTFCKTNVLSLNNTARTNVAHVKLKIINSCLPGVFYSCINIDQFDCTEV
jgi:hypothetical protein